MVQVVVRFGASSCTTRTNARWNTIRPPTIPDVVRYLFNIRLLEGFAPAKTRYSFCRAITNLNPWEEFTTPTWPEMHPSKSPPEKAFDADLPNVAKTSRLELQMNVRPAGSTNYTEFDGMRRRSLGFLFGLVRRFDRKRVSFPHVTDM
ncbi:hypothetical protein [Rhizobium leguminosarum]|uniref:hypothetical protein n=1 Tax=Rhizobium leguminosarum TaxID=384 RepID=UPI00102F9A2F|nr:hypothetical protein [Rhizobium leguminosarum]TAY88107.1 hypothetical protein ELH83_09905 [Rhizobium leguminosarum]